MNEKKKICLIIPTLNAGGMERVMSLLANYLVSRGYFVSVVLLSPYTPFFILEKEVKLILPDKVFKKNFFDAFCMFIYIRSMITKIHPDVILSFGERYNSYVLFSLLGTSYPVLISDRSSPKKKLPYFYIWLSRLLYPYANGIILQTNLAAILMKERIGKKCPPIYIIPNPLKEIQKNICHKKENIILSVGRLVTEKRYDRFLDIATMINLTGWKIIIVGDGPLRTFIENEISRRKLSNFIILQGNVQNIDEFYSRAKIFVLTSDSEGFPNCLCEAMAHGLACIAFDCVAGPSEIIKNGKNGILIEDGDTVSFAYYLQKLMLNDEYRRLLGQEAEKIRSTLNSNYILRLYENVLTI